MNGNSKSREIKFFKELNLSIDGPDAEGQWLVERGNEKLEPTFPSKAAAIRHWEGELLRLAQSHHFFETLKFEAKNWSRKEVEPIIAWLHTPGAPYPPAFSKMQGVRFEPTMHWRRKASKIYRDLGAIGSNAENMLRTETATILQESKADLGEKRCSDQKKYALQSGKRSATEGQKSIRA